MEKLGLKYSPLHHRDSCSRDRSRTWTLAATPSQPRFGFGCDRRIQADGTPRQTQHKWQSDSHPRLAQGLPFTDSSFDTAIATFPAEYITDPLTLAEVRRCLSDGGRFIVLPVALQIGRKPLDRVMSLLFRVTRQSPVDPLEEFKEKLRIPFIEAGFAVDVQELHVKSSLLLVIIAIK